MTAQPGFPLSASPIALEERYGAANYLPLPVVLSRGEGVHLWAQDGRRYIDMMSAYSAVSFGHGHPRLVEANPDPVAGRPWLGDLEHGRSDPEPVADADLVVGEPVDGEVLAELAVRQLGPPELPFPVAIRLDLIDEDRALLSPVAREVALTVPVQV